MQYSPPNQWHFLKELWRKASSIVVVLVLFFNNPQLGIATQDLPAADPFKGQQDAPAKQDEPVLPAPQDDPPEDETAGPFLNNVYTGWQQAGTGRNGARLDDSLRANWIMVDEEGTLKGNVALTRILDPPEPMPQILRDPNYVDPDFGGDGYSGAHWDPRLSQRFDLGFNPNFGNGFDPRHIYNPRFGMGMDPHFGHPFDPRCSSCMDPRFAGFMDPRFGDPRFGDPLTDPEQANATPDSFRPALPRAFMDVFLVNRGRMIATTSADENGDFKFEGVKQGNYALVGHGRAGFFAFGLNVLEYSEAGKAPTEIKVSAMENHDSFNSYWVTEFAPRVKFRIFGENRFEEKNTDPAKYYGLLGLSSFVPAGVPASTIQPHPVGLTEDGLLLGRVHQTNSFDGRPVDIQNTEVFLIKENSVIGRAGTDNYGVFEFEGVEPGGYGLVAIGTDGVAAFGIEVTGGGQSQQPSSRIFQPHSGAFNISTVNSASRDDPLPLDFTLVSSETIGWLNHYMAEESYQNAISAPRQPAEEDRFGEGDPFGFGMPYGMRPGMGGDPFGCGCGGMGCDSCSGGCGHDTTCTDCGGCLDCGHGCKRGCGCRLLRHHRK